MNAGQLNAIRCSLYFAVALLTPLAPVFDNYGVNGEWPPLPEVASKLLGGIIAALIAVRAYLDGSNERYQQRQEGKP
jgi:hypothetical protein